jgi:hypothetical protein
MDGTLVKTLPPRQLLSRLLEEPELVAIVRELEAPVLGRLIRHVGLEDAGELVALASTPQLERIFDEDLWQLDQPGQNEAFDAQRFTSWLEILLEAGPTFAARRLLEMNEDLVMLGLCEHLRAIDSERVAASMWKGAEAGCDSLLQQALDSQHYHEFEQFIVYSIHEPSWATWLTLLLELERLQLDVLSRWLERLADISADSVDDEDDAVDGYYHALRRAETLADDVAAQRGERREQQGYISPSDALSFLRSARRCSLVEILGAPAPDPITQAYFRDYFTSLGDPANAPASVRSEAVAYDESVQGGDGAAPSPAAARWLSALREVDAAAPRRLLPAGTSQAPELPVRVAMLALKRVDPALYSRRVVELSYLANILLSGASHEARNFRPVEAAEAALALCNLGFERALGLASNATTEGSESKSRAIGWLTRHDLVTAFRAGLHVAHHELVLASSRALATRLQRSASCTTAKARAQEFSRLASALAHDAARQEPWRSCSHLDVLETILPPRTLAAFRALLAECPTLPPQLSHTDRTSTSGFVTHIAQVHQIAAMLARFESGSKRYAPGHRA